MKIAVIIVAVFVGVIIFAILLIALIGSRLPKDHSCYSLGTAAEVSWDRLRGHARLCFNTEMA